MYCTTQDIKNRISEEVLIRLTDDEGLEMVNERKVTEAIEEACGEIDAYCQGRYTLPFDPVPRIIKKLSVDLTVHALFARRGINPDDNADQVVIQQRKDAIRFLELVAKGTVSLGPAPEETQAPAENVEFSGPERIFSRESMSGF